MASLGLAGFDRHASPTPDMPWDGWAVAPALPVQREVPGSLAEVNPVYATWLEPPGASCSLRGGSGGDLVVGSGDGCRVLEWFDVRGGAPLARVHLDRDVRAVVSGVDGQVVVGGGGDRRAVDRQGRVIWETASAGTWWLSASPAHELGVAARVPSRGVEVCGRGYGASYPPDPFVGTELFDLRTGVVQRRMPDLHCSVGGDLLACAQGGDRIVWDLRRGLDEPIVNLEAIADAPVIPFVDPLHGRVGLDEVTVLTVAGGVRPGATEVEAAPVTGRITGRVRGTERRARVEVYDVVPSPYGRYRVLRETLRTRRDGAFEVQKGVHELELRAFTEAASTALWVPRPDMPVVLDLERPHPLEASVQTAPACRLVDGRACSVVSLDTPLLLDRVGVVATPQ